MSNGKFFGDLVPVFRMMVYRPNWRKVCASNAGYNFLLFNYAMKKKKKKKVEREILRLKFFDVDPSFTTDSGCEINTLKLNNSRYMAFETGSVEEKRKICSVDILDERLTRMKSWRNTTRECWEDVTRYPRTSSRTYTSEDRADRAQDTMWLSAAQIDLRKISFFRRIHGFCSFLGFTRFCRTCGRIGWP